MGKINKSGSLEVDLAGRERERESFPFRNNKHNPSLQFIAIKLKQAMQWLRQTLSRRKD